MRIGADVGAREHEYRHLAQHRAAAEFLAEREHVLAGQAQRQQDQVRQALARDRQRLARLFGAAHVPALALQPRDQFLARPRFALDQQHVATAVARSETLERLGQPAPVHGLVEEVRGTLADRLVARIEHGLQHHRDVARLLVVLQHREHCPAVHARHHQVEHDQVRPLFARQPEALVAALGLEHAAALAAQHPCADRARVRVVVDHQHRLRARWRRCRQELGFRAGRRRGKEELRHGGGIHRQLHGEHAAVARFARRTDAAAEQLAELAAQRQSEPGAAVTLGGRGIGLHEGLEHAVELRLRHADAGIAHAKSQPIGAFARESLGVHRDLAVSGELAGVADEVREDLAKARLVADQRRLVRYRGDADRVAVVRGERVHGGAELAQHLDRVEGLAVERHLAGLDLREIEHVGDQGEQVPARGEDALHVAAELGGGQILLLGGHLDHHLAVADDRVERCAQFVAHVGQEAALGGVGAIGLLLGLLHFQHRGAQLLRHVVEGRGKLPEFVVRGHRDAVVEIAAADPDRAFAQTHQRLVGVADQQEAEQAGHEDRAEEDDHGDAPDDAPRRLDVLALRARDRDHGFLEFRQCALDAGVGRFQFGRGQAARTLAAQLRQHVFPVGEQRLRVRLQRGVRRGRILVGVAFHAGDELAQPGDCLARALGLGGGDALAGRIVQRHQHQQLLVHVVHVLAHGAGVDLSLHRVADRVERIADGAVADRIGDDVDREQQQHAEDRDRQPLQQAHAGASAPPRASSRSAILSSRRAKSSGLVS